jgi:hypothetical protein
MYLSFYPLKIHVCVRDSLEEHQCDFYFSPSAYTAGRWAPQSGVRCIAAWVDQESTVPR